MHNEVIIKVTSGKHHNITYENNELYQLDLSPNEYYIVFDSTNNGYHINNPLLDVDSINARYVGRSRIDGHQMFSVDIISSMRSDKIDKIIE